MSIKLNEYHVSRRTGFLLEDPLVGLIIKLNQILSFVVVSSSR